MRDEGEEIQFSRVEVMNFDRRDLLALRCQDGGVPYYLIFADLDPKAESLAKEWRRARLRREVLRTYEQAADEHVRKHYRRKQVKKRPVRKPNLRVIK